MRLGDLLIQRNLITEEQLKIALAVQRITGQVLGKTLISLGFVTPSELAENLALQQGLEYLSIKNYPIEPHLLDTFSRDTALTAKFLPLAEEEDYIKIALTDPGNIVAIDLVRSTTGKKVKPYITDEEGFLDTIEKAYYFMENPTEKIIDEVTRTVINTNAVPADRLPQLVEAILAEAIRRDATDVHISTNADVLTVFYRVDGMLQFAFALPKILHSGIISRIKILSRLDIAEQRLPQDGAFLFDFLGRKYDIRVSTIPTIDGESMVLRILFGGSEEIYSLTRLGFGEKLILTLRNLIRKPYGIMLVVGPTGSGKSATLHALLREVDRLRRSVITIEDPVEYRISFAKQSEVNEKIGYDFAIAGRNFMRHDPDIILLGEVRDEDTARIAIRAAITGHLVLSTLHTNDAVSAIPRLFDLGADKFLLSSALLAVLSQRLIRKICPFCKEERVPTDREIEILSSYGLKTDKIYYGKGCKACRNTGYLGRTAIGEIMTINDELRDMIYTGASFNSLIQASKKNGMIPMKMDGLKKVIEGVTTLREVERVVG
jgi:type II secretory ATPase GspE/PulE/Tfp pilus assembly ATPase PilB-like protein